MARPTKKNIIRCKRLKGGRAGCWIKEKGKTVFRFADRKYLSGLGIAVTEGKLLPGFTGTNSFAGTRKRKKRGGGRRTGCKILKNGRKACWTAKGFRIVG